MRQVFKNSQLNMMLYYFLLAVAVILAYKAIQDMHVAFAYVKRLFSIISPFFYGFILAYVLNIPYGGIHKLLLKTKNKFICKRIKMISIIISYLLLIIILFLALRLIIPSIYRSIYVFVANYQTYYDSLYDFIHYINDLKILNIDLSMDTIMNAIRDFSLEKLPASANALVSFSSALFSGFFSGFLAFVASIYILIEKDNFKKYLCRLLDALLPEVAYHVILRYTGDLNKNFKQYVYTQTIDGCILGTIATIELTLLGSPYALVLGIILGIVNYIPYFGSIFGSLAAVVVVAFTQSLPAAGLTGAILLITQQIDGNVIQPRLMSGSFSLSPLLVIISITVGGAFYGIFGMLAAIPIVSVIKNILDEIIAYYEQRKIHEMSRYTDH